MKTKERWLPVPNYEWAYVVSNQGRIRSLDRVLTTGTWQKGQAIRLRISGQGYYYVILWHGGEAKTFRVCRLVLRAFRGAPPQDHESAHRNGDRLDDRLSNLTWKTHIDNLRDRHSHGTQPQGERNGRAKLKANEVLAMRALMAKGVSGAVAGRMYGVTQAVASKIKLRTLWSHI